jgi:hypothetical protein
MKKKIVRRGSGFSYEGHKGIQKGFHRKSAKTQKYCFSVGAILCDRPSMDVICRPQNKPAGTACGTSGLTASMKKRLVL